MALELDESKQNVGKRLEFIEAELKKIDANIFAKQAEQRKLGDEIAEMQMKMQSEAAAAAKRIAGV